MYKIKGFLCKKAFTLIELLIVIAIIAILAAIAIPNFLMAQVRSKVARTKNDLKTLATALEAYYVDNNAYPLMMLISYEGGYADVWGVDPWVGPSGTNEMFISQKLSITTPIAYITKEPEDPFYIIPQYTGFHPGCKRYCYSSHNAYAIGAPTSDFVTKGQHRAIFGEWRLWGSGPDRDRRDIYHRSPPTASAIVYDPTNGTISNGDILRCQRTAEGRPFYPGLVE